METREEWPLYFVETVVMRGVYDGNSRAVLLRSFLLTLTIESTTPLYSELQHSRTQRAWV